MWGIGHTLALLAMTTVVFLLPGVLPAGFDRGLEIAVGAMLVVLGLDLVRRLWRDRVHVHAHRHEDGTIHLHAHSHRGDPHPHETSPHDHRHPARTPWRTLLVGLAHGAAGSAALAVYAAGKVGSAGSALLYVLLFGVGSIVGMATLTAVLALPLSATARRLTWANHALQGVVALVSVLVGARPDPGQRDRVKRTGRACSSHPVAAREVAGCWRYKALGREHRRRSASYVEERNGRGTP